MFLGFEDRQKSSIFSFDQDKHKLISLTLEALPLVDGKKVLLACIG